MNKKKRFFIRFIGVVLVIPIAVLLLLSAYKKLDSIYGIRREDSQKAVNAILLTESAKDCEDDLCMVFEENPDLEDIYIRSNLEAEIRALYLNDYTECIKRVEIKNGDTEIKHTYFNFKITKYDFSSLEPSQTIDVLKIFHENSALYKGYQLYYASIFSYEGDEILLLDLSSIPKKSTEQMFYKHLAYHIESQKIELVTGEEPYLQADEGAEAYSNQIRDFTYWDGYKLFQEKYFGEYLSSGDFEMRGSDQCSGRNYIYIRTKYLPAENEALYAKFPELKQYQGREDCTVYLSLTGFMSPEEIMTLLVEDGTEITFDGEILPAEKSKDGQEHAIQTFEDYNKWCKDETEDAE